MVNLLVYGNFVIRSRDLHKFLLSNLASIELQYEYYKSLIFT